MQRSVALLGRVADDGFVARGSFFQRDFIRKQREAGLPLHSIAHEDARLFRTSPEPETTGRELRRGNPASSPVGPSQTDEPAAESSWRLAA